MKCRSCEKGELRMASRDKNFEFRGRSILIPHVTGEECPNCGEIFIGLGEGIRTGVLMREHIQQVTASL